MKLQKYLALSFVVICGCSVTSCSSNSSDSLTLRILNSEDYIYLGDPQDPNDKDLVDRFVDYINNADPSEDPVAAKYKNKGVKVVYDTSDTNETIYSELLTGKSNYDLINVSDYMAQKIVSGGYAVPILDHSEGSDWDTIPNYEDYASPFIKSRLDNIIAVQKQYKEDSKKWEDVEIPLADYTVGYTWGTLGILFNPYYNTGIGHDYLVDQFYETDDDGEYTRSALKLQEVITDMMKFDVLWNKKYKGTISIKNSMRDTFAMALLYTYGSPNAVSEEFIKIRNTYLEVKERYDSGDASEEELLEAIEQYSKDFDSYFSRCDQKTVDEVYSQLCILKDNIFGLEVDSGKQDIVTQKIGINLAWSGDAVYSMDQAEDGLQVGENQTELCYAIPEYGTNLWFDTWLMPNCPRSDEQAELARLFLNFLSDPEVAALNMNYTGYTSVIAGDSMIDLVRDWYDIRTYEISQEVEVKKYTYEYYQIYAVSDDDFTALWYEDCMSLTHSSMMDEQKLYYFVPFVDQEGNYIEEPETREQLLAQNNPVMLFDDDEQEIGQKTYGDLLIADEDEELEVVDLSYFFSGTLDEYEEGDMIFYSDCYLPFVYEDENGDETQNICVGRQFFAQYPNEEVLIRSGIMKDYGENNKIVMAMWEKFKSNPLPPLDIVIFVVIIAIILAFAISLLVHRCIKTHLRKQRKANK